MASRDSDREVEERITNWWVERADADPPAPVAPPPVPTKAPRSVTATRIEEFIYRMEKFVAESRDFAGIRIDKMDVWLVADYHTDRTFRSFQAEEVSPDSGVAKKFNRVLRMKPEEFLKEREVKRKEHALWRQDHAKKKK